MQHRNKKDLLILFIKSILMGTANKLPGISGGLVALITGFYDEMILTFRKINFKTFQILFSGNFKKLNSEYNIIFLITILLGIIFSYFTTSKILDFFFKISELNVWSFFFGMIIASLIILIRDNKINTFKKTVFLIIGLFIGLILSLSEPNSENQNIIFIFFCGMISICGMIIPGISGSFLLILLGNYKLLLVDSVDALINSIYIIFRVDITNEIDFQLIKILIVFSLGSVVGLIVFSNILGYLIKKHRSLTNQLIIGFISGSLFIIWPWNKVVLESSDGFKKLSNLDTESNYLRYLPDINETSNIIALACIVTGFMIVLYIENYASRKKNIRPDR